MPEPTVLALDVGGTKLATGVVAADGTVLSFRTVETAVHEGPDAVVGRLLDLAEKTLAEAGHPEVIAVGIGCGGPLNPSTGVILGPPGLPGWDEVPLARMVTERLGLPAYVENDATAAALAEHRWGGWGVNSLVYLTISTGFGGGVVIDGELFRGAAGQGGELGHVVVDWQGRECGCGARGCAEAYVSGTSVARRATEALTARTSSLATIPHVTARDVAEHARAGDALAREVWDETTAMLGRMVAVIINVCEPALVVLGGGVTRAGAFLLDPVREGALRQAMPPAAKACDVVLSHHGDQAGVLGAAAIAFHRIDDNSERPEGDA
ncbi:ROK family protein [Kribbella sp. ALI-6-A]|uniref:ROK family protein n=1 Tax=Kribbella sp. ALI-6-A TaxID=1933817 RepID=UPI00097CBBBC|nr:ROK family protein [Kribbella sp. ALI-6-A]ONI67212.1 ROK family protein [Kribbella sp. ALI-6-A]